MKIKALIAAAVVVLATPMAASADEKVVVTHSTNSFAFLTFFAASAMNYFEEAGVDIEVVRTGAGSKSLAAVISGDADVYIGSTASVFSARANGVPVQIFGPVVTQLTSSIVVSKEWAESKGVTADSPLPEKLEALRGARIAMSGPGSGSEQAIRYIAIEAGLDPDRDMQIVVMGSNASTYFSAMQQGQIDGFSTSPPATHVAVQDQGATILINTAAGELPSLDGYFYIGMIAREEWLEENEETAAKMLVAIRMAMEAMQDPATSDAVGEAVHAKYFSEMDPELFAEVWGDQRDSVPDSLIITEEMVQQVIAFNNQFSEEKLDEALVLESYTNEPAKLAQQQFGG